MNKPNSLKIKNKMILIRRELNVLRQLSHAKKYMIKGKYIYSYKLLRKLSPTISTKQEKRRLVRIMKPVLIQILSKAIKKYSKHKRTYSVARQYCTYLRELRKKHRLRSRCRRLNRHKRRH